MTTYIIDRFEHSYAVLEAEDGTFHDVLKKELPKNCHAHDVLIFTHGHYQLDSTKTTVLKKEVHDLMDELFE